MPIACACVGPHGWLFALHGALDGGAFRAELLADEVPTYFGMLSAAFAPA
jgi:aromatic ring-opening dioxygenase LigB subunit